MDDGLAANAEHGAEHATARRFQIVLVCNLERIARFRMVGQSGRWRMPRNARATSLRSAMSGACRSYSGTAAVAMLLLPGDAEASNAPSPTPRLHGMLEPDAEWFWDFAEIRIPVVIHASR